MSCFTGTDIYQPIQEVSRCPPTALKIDEFTALPDFVVDDTVALIPLYTHRYSPPRPR